MIHQLTANKVDRGPRMIQQLGAKEIRRNDPCPCGSGRKFKKCCWAGTNLATAKLQTAMNRLNRVFKVGEGIIVKGVAFKINQILGDRIVLQDINMSDEDIAKLTGQKVEEQGFEECEGEKE